MVETQNRTEAVAAPTGAIVLSVDQPDDIIRLTCRGFVTPEEVSASFVILAKLFQERDARGRPIKILIDNRGMSIQSADTAECIGQGARKHHRAHHRVATLLASKLAAMQLRRVLDDQGPVIFDDEIEALTWLRTTA